MDKQIIYNKKPTYNELTQYLTETRTETEDAIIVDFVVNDVAQEEYVEPVVQSEPYVHIPVKSIEERVADTENKVVTIEETIDVLFGGV